MASIPVGNEGLLNGATPVVAVASPAASRQIEVGKVEVYNNDTVDHTFTVRKVKGGNNYILGVVQVKSTFRAMLIDRLVVLDATDEKIEIFIEGAHTTNAPVFDSAALDCS